MRRTKIDASLGWEVLYGPEVRDFVELPKVTRTKMKIDASLC